MLNPQVELGAGLALFGGPLKPLGSLRRIPRHAPAPQVHQPQVVLDPGVSVDGGLPVPVGGLAGIFRHPEAEIVQGTQGPLPRQTTSGGGFPAQGQGLCMTFGADQRPAQPGIEIGFLRVGRQGRSIASIIKESLRLHDIQSRTGAGMLDGMLSGTMAFLPSPDLLDEYRRVLLRPRLVRLHGLDEW